MSETTTRRDFFALAATTTVGAAAAAGTAEAGETAPETVETGAGYRETDHVRKYYETTRF